MKVAQSGSCGSQRKSSNWTWPSFLWTSFYFWKFLCRRNIEQTFLQSFDLSVALG